jgi:hypothetical protein
MAHSLDNDENAEVSQEIQENLRQISVQLGYPQDAAQIAQLYQSTQVLLDHLAPDSLTLARVAGVLLVYRLSAADPDEAKWFKAQLRDCQDEESIEELIDSISRPDAL